MTDVHQDVEERELEAIFDDLPPEERDGPGCDGDTAYKVIGCLVRSGLDDDEVVKAFVARPDALLLIPQLVRHCAGSLRRDRVREQEAKQRRAREAALQAPAAPHPTSLPVAASPARRKPIQPSRILPVSPAVAASWRLLADQSVDVPDANGRVHSVHWLDVTVEQHRARASWLRQHVASTVRTAKGHEDAAADCERAGVNTLRELLAQTSGGGRAA